VRYNVSTPATRSPVAALPAPGGDGFDELDETWLRSRPAAKWSSAGEGVIPCWVADMDFPTPRPVRQALIDLATGGDVGYPGRGGPAALEARWASRMAARYGWEPRPGRLQAFTDLVQAVQVLLGAASSGGDGVLLFTPAYPPLLRALESMGRQLLAVPAVDDSTGWTFDIGAATRGAAGAKILLLVNPHNPTGRMLRRSELEAMGQLAERHDLLVISDEVHADLALAGTTHVPFASLGTELEARTVTLYSASKSYNLGGMCCAVAHVGHAGVARELAGMPSHVLGHVSTAAVATTLASWSPEADAWLERCLARLRANRQLLGRWLDNTGADAGVKGYLPEGTYLSWLDFRPAGLGEDPARWLAANARVMLSPGCDFGPGGAGFARLNFATTPGILHEILDRIATALGQEPHGGQPRP
jgi:cystathionine beta-lyase